MSPASPSPPPATAASWRRRTPCFSRRCRRHPDLEAWAPLYALYALYYAPETIALLHLSRHGLLPALQKPANDFDLNHIAQALAAYDTEDAGRIFAGRLSKYSASCRML